MTGAGLQRFVLIGCGEAGSILGQDLAAAGRDVAIIKPAVRPKVLKQNAVRLLKLAT